jgi:hypothetical protein
MAGVDLQVQHFVGSMAQQKRRGEVMAKAYWITFYREISDPAKLAAYARLAAPSIEAGGGSVFGARHSRESL